MTKQDNQKKEIAWKQRTGFGKLSYEYGAPESAVREMRRKPYGCVMVLGVRSADNTNQE